MKEAVVSLVLLLLPLPHLAQLTGHRGVISLPDNFEYRDEETRLASQRAAAFARRVQTLADHEAQENRLKEVQKSFGVANETISFFTWGNRPPVAGGNNDGFYFPISRIIRSFPENVARINSVTSPGEHPCTFRRSTCDATEGQRAAALRLQASKPSNQDRLTNKLVPAGPSIGVGEGSNCGESSSTGNTCGPSNQAAPGPQPRSQELRRGHTGGGEGGSFTYFKYL